MSNWPGNLIRKTPITPAGPFQNGAAPGIWSLSEASYWTKQGVWPIAGNEQLLVENVFSTWLYTGNSETQTITNGINLSGRGGMVWIKRRSSSSYHALYDTTRGAGQVLQSQSTDAQINQGANGLSAFTSSGFSIGQEGGINAGSQTYASWTFREAPKFFDVVTYTGNGVAGRQIAHNLGVAPGMMIVKMTSGVEGWYVYHRGTSSPATKALVLNTTGAENAGTVNYWNSTAPTSTNFTLGSNYEVNNNGSTYVAYLYAHDTASDGIIQCGSFDVDGSGNATVNLGWEPQWVLMKNYEAGDAWGMYDNMRGMPVGNTNVARLFANSSNAESNSSDYNVSPTATGFTAKATGFAAPGANGFVYVAIRRGPMQVPTLGTTVFSPTAYTGTGTTGNIISLGVTPDLMIGTNLGGGNGNTVFTRLTANGQGLSYTNASDAEDINTTFYPLFDVMNGYRNRASGGLFNSIGTNYIRWAFRRAPGFFDVVCYTGDGTSGRTITSNLAATAELTIVKCRSNSNTGWKVWMFESGAFALQSNGAVNNAGSITSALGSGYITTGGSSIFINGGIDYGDGTLGGVNASGRTYVAYLFASCPGVSKVGTYTGNGSSQTINCAFTTGARFVLIKRANSTGDWYVWDSARGIVAGNDPYLALNSAAAEVTTDDSVDTDNTGFIVNQVAASNINVNAATYIFLAIA